MNFLRHLLSLLRRSKAPQWRQLEEGELYQPGDETIPEWAFGHTPEDSLQAPSLAGGWVPAHYLPGRRVPPYKNFLVVRRLLP